MSSPATRFMLRDLPVPAKLVLSAFLISVGLGYLSAMVQLHMKHSAKDGSPLPSPNDVIERFSGLKPHDPNAPPEKCKVSLLLGGDVNAPDVSKENMAPAFKAKSKGYEKLCAARGKPTVDAERDGEWEAMLKWVAADAAVRKASYDADSFAMPAEWKGKPLTAEFAAADGGAVKIKSLINARCQNCHVSQAPDLGNYGAIEPHVTAPSPEVIDGKWVRSSKQITTEALTQSTHAHLLSFSVLFTLTGLTFALTGLPAFIRGVVGPIVLIAQVSDIACWWLARVPGYGPYFAQTIMLTGAVVGLGLTAHILGGLFGMWGNKGKIVLLLVCLLGLAGIGTVMAVVIKPALDAQKKAAGEKLPAGPNEGDKKETAPPTKPNDPGKMVGQNPPLPESKPLSQLEKLLTGAWDDKTKKFNGKGTMVPAFFDKDGVDFKSEFKERGMAVVAEREGERAAVVAWVRLDDATRRKAYEADALPMPTDLSGKPVTPDYLSDDKATVKVKSILTDRCARCHASGSDQEDYPLESYEQIAKYLAGAGEAKPAAVGAKGEPEVEAIPIAE